jgi:hypothetical protein
MVKKLYIRLQYYSISVSVDKGRKPQSSFRGIKVHIFTSVTLRVVKFTPFKNWCGSYGKEAAYRI